MTPFDFVNLVLHTKKPEDELDFKDYAPFIVNRSLSYHIDCVLYANEMNLWPSTDKDMQYQYLLNSIRPINESLLRGRSPRTMRILIALKHTLVTPIKRLKKPCVFLLMNKSLK